MLFCKWVGGALLLFCALYLGFLQISAARRAVARAKGFLCLLRHIRLQIECFSLPVGDILASADVGMLAACGVKEGKPISFAALVQGSKDCLSREVYGELVAFAEQLGTSYRAEQLRLCDRHITRLAALCEQEKQEAARKERLWLFLPLALVGIVLLVLL